jgi:hypothetical protein
MALGASCLERLVGEGRGPDAAGYWPAMGRKGPNQAVSPQEWAPRCWLIPSRSAEREPVETDIVEGVPLDDLELDEEDEDAIPHSFGRRRTAF